MSSISYNQTVTELFEKQVERTPSLIALQDRKIKLTYLELNERANQVASILRKNSINPKDVIALILEPSSDFIIFILAIIKIGAVYVPIDTMAPQNRLKELIDDSQPKLIITDKSYLTKISNLNYTFMLSRQISLESISAPSENHPKSIGSNAPIYMMYTSGSTGKPKGVIIPHCAVVNLVAVDNYALIHEGDVVAQFSNLSFDGSTFEIWSAFLNGATLSVVPLPARSNHNELKALFQESPVSHLFLPTGFFHQVIKSAPSTLSTVKHIIFGGEQANVTLLRHFLQSRKIQQNPVVLINGYGPTEATTFTCKHVMNEQQEYNDEQLACIGSTIDYVKAYILDEELQESNEGELYISGINLALGYHNSEQNHLKFIDNPLSGKTLPYDRLYKTGDKVRKLSSGELICLGRLDDQVKIGGFRIHLNEIEQQLMKHPNVALSAVTVELGGGMHKILTAYIVFSSKEHSTYANDIRSFLETSLPSYMLPVKYVLVDDLPLTAVGKIDKKILHTIPHTDLSYHIDVSSSSSIEDKIKNVWQHLLNLRHIETHKNLFELGANSLLITEACSIINDRLNSELQIADMLAYPTIHKLSRYLEGDVEPIPVPQKKTTSSTEIAIIGMSCRFPGANNLSEFWDNLCQGKDTLTRFNINEINHVSDMGKHYVPVKGILNDIEQFDASFFGFSPVDARITDPQHRIFLECVWEALEHAGVAPEKNPSKTISVFSGMTDSTYLQEHLLKNHWFCNEHDGFQQRIATSIGMLSTQVSYRLNLKGRSVNINTACSTGLITVDQACQDLITGKSDIAIAGASSIVLPQTKSYQYQEGSIVSPDGVCRPFADTANGTVFSSGVGVVILKRLSDAIEEGDTVYAVIKSSSVNNDGSDKLGYTAPSLSGQISCIREALAQANISASEIDFLEAHGTATALGDVIEISALTSVYREQSDEEGYCALGSVKANIGHTDVTAGIAGLIKTALCLYHRKIPPLIHFNAPNPNLLLDKSPFFVNSKLIELDDNSRHYHAGVSAFGVGGTNSHFILSNYIENESTFNETEKERLFVFSAKSQKALEKQLINFTAYVASKNTTNDEWGHTAYTLQTGRENFPWRQFIVCKNTDEFQENKISAPTFAKEDMQYSRILMFSGQGTQYPLMAMELYTHIPLFKRYVDLGIELAKPYLGLSLLDILMDSDTSKLNQTEYTQPALFIIEYALSQVLLSCGIKPDALIGHSLGEYVAACIAEIFSFEDGIALVCERGLLMAKAEKGTMLALTCTKEDLINFQKVTHFDIALHNATEQYVLAGTKDSISQLKQYLTSIGKTAHELAVSHAFHSQLMEPLKQSIQHIFSHIKLSPPKIPIVSNVTGHWLSDSDATDPNYWYQHVRCTVQFHQGIQLLLRDEHPLFIEVGLGQSLCGFVQESSSRKAVTLFTLPNRHKQTSELFQLQKCLGNLWSLGLTIKPHELFENQKNKHIPLPTYPFQKQKYWLEADKKANGEHEALLYKHVWNYKKLNTSFSINQETKHDWIIFTNKNGIGLSLIELLSGKGIHPIIIESGDQYNETSFNNFEIDLSNESHYIRLMSRLKTIIKNPIIIHSLSHDTFKQEICNKEQLDTQLEASFFSLLYVTKAYIQEIGSDVPLKCAVISSGVFNILGTDTIHPVNASLIGACRVVPIEHTSMHYQFIDLESENLNELYYSYSLSILNRCLYTEWHQNLPDIAYRNGFEWELSYAPIKTPTQPFFLADNRTYLITGGLGGIGLTIAESIALNAVNPTLILCSRSSSIPESEWANILDNSSHQEHKKMVRIKNIQNLGAKIHCVQVDISNSNEIDTLFSLIKTKYTPLSGIIHSAGVPGAGLAQLKTKDKAYEVFLSKIHGTYNLALASKQMPLLDFVVFMSSIASITGERGQIDYCGANACLDSFATSNLFSAKRTLSINWNTWEEVGMSVETSRPDDMNLFARGNSISTKKGQSIFMNALSHQYPNVIVSNYDLDEYKTLVQSNTPSHPQETDKALRDNLDISMAYSAPINANEESLAKLWQESLYIEKIGRDDDFFALGGHSLKAISLIERINTIHKSALSIQHLYQSPTIAKLSNLLDNQQTSVDAIVKLSDGETDQPSIFFIHPVSGMIYCFNTLVSELSLPISIYAIQDPSISEGTLTFTSIIEMSEYYVNQIQKINPNGPYFIVGYSFGGTIAYEVANVLKKQNKTIALLGMIDSWCVFSESQQNEQHFTKNYLSQELQTNNELANLAWARMNLLLQHKPSHSEQDIVLFKACELGEDYISLNQPLNGWSEYTKGTVHCHSVKANHESIINSKQLSTILSQYILTNLQEYDEVK